jgi:type II secretory pathway component PulL
MYIAMANRDPLLEEVKDEFEYCTQKCRRYRAMFPGNRKYHDATCIYKKFLSASPQI